MNRCPTCGERLVPCEICARRRRYGAIAHVVAAARDQVDWLDALEALAELMIDRHRLMRAHRKELFEEQREGQRAARDAFSEGRAEARAEGEDGW